MKQCMKFIFWSFFVMLKVFKSSLGRPMKITRRGSNNGVTEYDKSLCYRYTIFIISIYMIAITSKPQKGRGQESESQSVCNCVYSDKFSSSESGSMAWSQHAKFVIFICQFPLGIFFLNENFY